MTGTATIFDTRLCELGEGPLWHPGRAQLFWFDITGNRLLSREGDNALEWQFDENHSAAGWVDHETLLIASETGLWRFDIATGDRKPVCALEADDASTRSNDGRADPFGGFWIGTMGKNAEPGRGSIYRFYNGKLRCLYDKVTIPNSICFAPDGRFGYFTDTLTQKIYQQPLDEEGWPKGDPELFLDLTQDKLYPDGSVVDAEGALWNAQWGAGRVARYLPDGRLERTVQLAGRHSACPAFGGSDLSTLFITTARQGLVSPNDAQGCVYQARGAISGQPEHQVILARD